MSLLFKIGNWGGNTRNTPCFKEMLEKLFEGKELLTKKKDLLEEKIAQELQIVKSNSRTNKKVALQALKRKKSYEKELKFLDGTVKAMRFAQEIIDIVTMLYDLSRDMRREQNGAGDPLDTSVEFDEDELLAELERLEKSLQESPVETDGMEETEMSFAVSASHSAEEEEVEAGLEYLRRWMNDQS